jgi:hypothetical protein
MERIGGSVPHLAVGDSTAAIVLNPGLLPAVATERLAGAETVDLAHAKSANSTAWTELDRLVRDGLFYRLDVGAVRSVLGLFPTREGDIETIRANTLALQQEITALQAVIVTYRRALEQLREVKGIWEMEFLGNEYVLLTSKCIQKTDYRLLCIIDGVPEEEAEEVPGMTRYEAAQNVLEDIIELLQGTGENVCTGRLQAAIVAVQQTIDAEMEARRIQEIRQSMMPQYGRVCLECRTLCNTVQCMTRFASTLDLAHITELMRVDNMGNTVEEIRRTIERMQAAIRLFNRMLVNDLIWRILEMFIGELKKRGLDPNQTIKAYRDFAGDVEANGGDASPEALEPARAEVLRLKTLLPDVHNRLLEMDY